MFSPSSFAGRSELNSTQDLFSQLFGGGGGGFFGGGGGGGGGRSAGPRRTKDLVHRINVSLEDLYKGKTTKLALTRNVICVKCDGKGGKEGAVRTCTGCSGRGVRVTLRQMGPMIQQLQSACDECSGTGEVINHKDKCKTCNGRKTVSEKKTLEVHVDKGMKGGQTITFHGESDQAPGASPGDVIIEIVERPHDRFRRQNNDLLVEFEVDLLTALGGGQFGIKHLDERALLVTIVPGEIIKNGSYLSYSDGVIAHGNRFSGDLKVIRGQGMPSLRHHEPGDMFVKLSVKFPDSIDPALIPQLEKVLPPRTPVEKFGKGIQPEEVFMEEMDARQKAAQERDDAMDEDEEQPRVQCANQ
jgi:DnaJ family protein A protein 2